MQCVVVGLVRANPRPLARTDARLVFQELDFSVAKKGMLCAYRWDGEQTLSDDKFAWVKAG